jgi:hypothetical protein
MFVGHIQLKNATVLSAVRKEKERTRPTMGAVIPQLEFIGSPFMTIFTPSRKFFIISVRSSPIAPFIPVGNRERRMPLSGEISLAMFTCATH